MAVFEQITKEITKIVTRVDDIPNSLPVLELSVNALLAEFPHTLEYVVLGCQYSSGVLKSWIESISTEDWTDVSFKTILNTYLQTSRAAAIGYDLLYINIRICPIRW